MNLLEVVGFSAELVVSIAWALLWLGVLYIGVRLIWSCAVIVFRSAVPNPKRGD